MKIAFVGNYQYNCGSSNALLGYVKAGEILGHDVRVSEFGYIDRIIRRSIPVAKRNWEANLLVIVYESYPFLSDIDIDKIVRYIPRSRRVIIDPDSKYLEPHTFEDDTNHPTSDSYNYWTQLYDYLSDTILQPTLRVNTIKNVKKFIYFGINTKKEFSKIKKDFDFLYIGNNWFRWKDISRIIKSTALVRGRFKRIAVIGNYWFGETMEGFESATHSDPNLFKVNNIEIFKSVPYGQVEHSMSRGLVNPILVRPILYELKFVTPRMFETFAADTVPVYPKYFSYAVDIYGQEARKLLLSDQPAQDILKILDDYENYISIARRIRADLIEEHSYETRLQELVKFV